MSSPKSISSNSSAGSSVRHQRKQKQAFRDAANFDVTREFMDYVNMHYSKSQICAMDGKKVDDMLASWQRAFRFATTIGDDVAELKARWIKKSYSCCRRSILRVELRRDHIWSSTSTFQKDAKKYFQMNENFFQFVKDNNIFDQDGCKNGCDLTDLSPQFVADALAQYQGNARNVDDTYAEQMKATWVYQFGGDCFWMKNAQATLVRDYKSFVTPTINIKKQIDDKKDTNNNGDGDVDNKKTINKKQICAYYKKLPVIFYHCYSTI